MKYTADDFEWMVTHPTTCTDPNDPIYQKHHELRNYFIEHPEDALGSRTCQKHGLTAEKVRAILKGERTGPF